jgi:hypothetical protein
MDIDIRTARIIVARLVKEACFADYQDQETALGRKNAEKRYWRAKELLALAELDARETNVRI